MGVAVQGFAVLALLVGVAWIFGGVALRVGGYVAVAVGLTVLAAGARMWFGVALAAAGVVAWGFGHAHFRARHGFWSSPLARLLASRRPTLQARRGGRPR